MKMKYRIKTLMEFRNTCEPSGVLGEFVVSRKDISGKYIVFNEHDYDMCGESLTDNLAEKVLRLEDTESIYSADFSRHITKKMITPI